MRLLPRSLNDMKPPIESLAEAVACVMFHVAALWRNECVEVEINCSVESCPLSLRRKFLEQGKDEYEC
jgi:hypothetical protein